MRGVLALVCALACLWPAAAGAAPGVTVGMEDERLLFESPATAASVVAQWKAIGVDVVRLHARWSDIAPGTRALRRPSGFNPADHTDRGYDWHEIDAAVDLLERSGLGVLMTVTGPGPLWSSRDPRRREPQWRPDPRGFGQFARALGNRYRGRVAAYLIWNEPNQPGWLAPQWDCVRVKRRQRCTMASPHVYREIVLTAEPALHAADPGAEILVGELAPIGRPGNSRSSPVAPLPFLRELACVDSRYRPVRTGYCRRFRPVAADALGYHPHPVSRAPDQTNPDRDEAALADLSRLTAVLDRLTGSGRIRARGDRLDLWLTEFGYQTSPPDHGIGIPAGTHSRWLQHAAYLAWAHPRVRNLTHYQWEDEPVVWRGDGKKAYSGWQSGLHYVDGNPKPALATFRDPLVFDTDRGRIWGHARPGPRHQVTVERRISGSSPFEAIATLTTDTSGVFAYGFSPDTGMEYRFSWVDDGGPQSSGILRIGDDASGVVSSDP